MKMEFIFDNDKLIENNLTIEQVLFPIRKYFKNCNKKTIYEEKPGVFVGTSDDWADFSAISFLPRTKWFLRVIKEWYWYVDEYDGRGLQKEDMLSAYKLLQQTLAKQK
jgi:hypothetical protein